MKKLFYFFAVAMCATLMITACKPSEEKTVNEIVLSDYDYMVKTGTDFQYRETQIELNGAIDTMDIEDLSVKRMTSVAQTDDGVYFLDRNGLSQKYPDVDIVEHDVWLGSEGFNPYEQIKVTFEDALMIVKDSLETLPNSRFVTIRIPVSPRFYKNPFYIFGGAAKGYVTVDAFTGELNTME